MGKQKLYLCAATDYDNYDSKRGEYARKLGWRTAKPAPGDEATVFLGRELEVELPDYDKELVQATAAARVESLREGMKAMRSQTMEYIERCEEKIMRLQQLEHITEE